MKNSVVFDILLATFVGIGECRLGKVVRRGAVGSGEVGRELDEA